jgi:REP element-mobilizing transposase RayT
VCAWWRFPASLRDARDTCGRTPALKCRPIVPASRWDATNRWNFHASYYPALSNLFNEIGKDLKPKVRCVINIANRGAALPDGGFFTADQIKKVDPNPMQGQLPARGVVEVKGPAEDVAKVARSEQVTRYAARYGVVLVTNYRDFLVLGRDTQGNPLPAEPYTLADSEAAFWQSAAHPQKTAAAHGAPFYEYLVRVMKSNAPLTDPRDVAWFLASYARTAKSRVESHKDLPALAAVRNALEEALGMEFTGEKGEHFFRSTLIQTIFYGVFSAWVLWHRERSGVAQPPSAVNSGVAQPPSAVNSGVAQPPSAVKSGVAQPPPAVNSGAPPRAPWPKAGVAQPPSAVNSGVAQPPSAVNPPLAATASPAEYRRNLPHIQSAAKPIYITFSTFNRWILPEFVRDLVLKHCLHDHGRKYWLHAAIIMPDHVHMVLRVRHDADDKPFGLPEILNGIKGASAHSINKALKRKGHVWQDESFDHILRSKESLEEKEEYVRNNPVRQALVHRPEEWPWFWGEWMDEATAGGGCATQNGKATAGGGCATQNGKATAGGGCATQDGKATAGGGCATRRQSHSRGRLCHTRRL